MRSHSLSQTILGQCAFRGCWWDAIASYGAVAISMNYCHLKNLLIAQQWQDAERHTWMMMKQVSGQHLNNYLDTEDILTFPCQDLLTIDYLWTQHSKGRFGFSSQFQVWQKVGGGFLTSNDETNNEAYEIHRRFGKQVGWYVEGKWLTENELCFNLSAPFGHLPWFRGGFCGWVGFPPLAARLQYCQLEVSFQS